MKASSGTRWPDYGLIMKNTMKSVSRMMTSSIAVATLAILSVGLLTSCHTKIDPVAANSSSAILAVIGEYLYATFALIIFVFLWILRPAGIALVGLGVLGLCNYVDMSANPIFLICIGIMMFFASFVPIKQYEPTVVISKHFKMSKDDSSGKMHNCSYNFFIQLLIGFITLIIEYTLFVK